MSTPARLLIASILLSLAMPSFAADAAIDAAIAIPSAPPRTASATRVTSPPRYWLSPA